MRTAPVSHSLHKAWGLFSVLICLAAGIAQEASIKSITRVTKITWDSQFGKAYQVRWSESPGGPWEALGDPLPGTGAEMFAYDEARGAGKRFYRLEVTDITPPGMVPVPGGTYEMGDHFGIDEYWSSPVHTVHVDSFYMDATEVTNSDFCAFINALKQAGEVEVLLGRDALVYRIAEPQYAYSLIRFYAYNYTDLLHDEALNMFRIASERDQHPATGVSWYGAAAFCNWRSEQEGLQPCYDAETWECDFGADGYRLPTEAEWEYAARGGLRYARYPWGGRIDGSKATYRGSGDPHENDHWDGLGEPTTPVAFYPPNEYGLYDMAGNAKEWCNDWLHPHYYTYCVENGIVDNSPGPAERYPCSYYGHVLRGGSCTNAPEKLLCSARFDSEIVCLSGFRCVRRPSTPCD